MIIPATAVPKIPPKIKIKFWRSSASVNDLGWKIKLKELSMRKYQSEIPEPKCSLAR